MKFTVSITDNEVNTIIEMLKEQGMDFTRIDIEEAIKDYIYGTIEDSQESRVDSIVDSFLND